MRFKIGVMKSYTCKHRLQPQENISLTISFSDKKMLVNIVTNLDINLQNKKLLVTKIIIIMNKKI